MTEDSEEKPGMAGPQLLRAILDTAVGAIIAIDDSGRIQMINPATERLFGYAPSELIGRNVSMLMPEPHRSGHDGYLRHHVLTGEKKIIGIGREVEGLRKDDTRFPMHLSISAFEVDEQRFFAGILHDLTERDRIKGELERQGSIFETVFDNVPEALIVTDNNRTIALCNRAVSDVFGYQSDDLVGHDVSAIYASTEEYDRIGALRSGLAPGQRLGPVRTSYRHRSGDEFPGQTIGAYIVDRTGRITGFLTLVRDIRFELQQQRALGIAQRMEAFGQLTGGIAHDFNNLLTVITGNHELLEMRLQDERNRTLLKRAQEAAEMGARLTDRLLMFARRRQFETVRLNLNEQVVSMADLLRRTIGEQIHLATTLESQLWEVEIDPSEIENAILNLAINARDAMPVHGRLVIETANVDIEPDVSGAERVLAPGPYVRLSVSDTGTGMTPEVIERAFEPFYTTKPSGKGTGLGLSTIYGFVSQLGGTVTIYSELGHGTTVNLYLPRVEGEANTKSYVAEEAVEVAGQGERVLLAEDNAEVRLVTRQRLEELGYTVLEVENGQAAIALLESGRDVDIIFSDIVMTGGITGFDVARWVRAHRPSIPILLTSGFAADAIAAQDGELPDVEILRKPYRRSELAAAIRRTLNP